MKRIGTALALAALLVASLAAVAGAQTAQKPPLREFEGTVVSINRDAKTFRLRDSERGTKRIKVTANTRYERVGGFGALEVGQRNIEAKTRRRAKGGAWIAIEVERSGGGGEHGGDDRGGDDD